MSSAAAASDEQRTTAATAAAISHGGPGGAIEGGASVGTQQQQQQQQQKERGGCAAGGGGGVLGATDADGAVFRVANNDGTDDNMVRLIGFKAVISEQLPNMPKEYIIRIVLDRNHRSIVVMKENKVIGGICFRPFHSQGFAEIVFLAITESQKHKGFGSRLMNHLKEHVKTEKIMYFLTYADNTAIGYFVKQGFTKKKSMPKWRWEGYIKDYVRSTLMECRILFNVNYLQIPAMIARQREAVISKVKTISNSHIVRGPIEAFQNGAATSIRVEDIPGVLEAGYCATRRNRRRVGPLSDLQAQLGAVLKLLRKDKDSWPFQKPVEEWEAPNYYEVIKRPMDLSTMEKKLNEAVYISKELFVKDVMLIVENCQTYNAPDTVYAKCAISLQKRCRKLMKKVKG